MERYRWACAYRQGRLVAGRVGIAVERHDDRVGLSRRERRRVVARFVEHVEPELRATELGQAP